MNEPLSGLMQVMLWAAINRYTAACGGDTSNRTVSLERELAVVELEKLFKLIRRGDE